MTWDQDQVDSLIKIFNWTNFEKKFCRLNTSNVVFSECKRYFGAQGFQILVQGSRRPDYVNHRIEEFLSGMRKQIKDMLDEEFESVRKALIANKLEKPKMLSARVERYWTQIRAQR